MNKLRALLGLPRDVVEGVVTYLPGPAGFALRRWYWRRRGVEMGAGVRIDVGACFQNPEYVRLGERCWIDRGVLVLAGPPAPGRITFAKGNPDFPLETGEVAVGAGTHVGPGCVLSGMGGLWIGENCGLAAGCAVYSFSHHYRNVGDREDRHQYAFTPLARPDQQAMVLSPVVIGDYCAVGLHSVLLPGTTLARGTWVGCAMVVRGAYPEQSLLLAEAEPEVDSLAHLTIKE